MAALVEIRQVPVVQTREVQTWEVREVLGPETGAAQDGLEARTKDDPVDSTEDSLACKEDSGSLENTLVVAG